jgi:hypothetical protein
VSPLTKFHLSVAFNPWHVSYTDHKLRSYFSSCQLYLGSGVPLKAHMSKTWYPAGGATGSGWVLVGGSLGVLEG